jgi:two-component system cell cycle response regulator
MVDLMALELPLKGLQAAGGDQESKSVSRIEVVDGLTRVFHREFFDVQYEIQWKIAARKHEPLVLFLIDVDQFSSFNAMDRRSGDYALQKIAKTLGLLIRRSTDFVARYKGDQFIILGADMSEVQAKAHALRICERVQSLKILDRQSGQYLSVSVGYVVGVPDAGKKPRHLLDAATRYLKIAKSLGKGMAHGSGAKRPA